VPRLENFSLLVVLQLFQNVCKSYVVYFARNMYLPGRWRSRPGTAASPCYYVPEAQRLEEQNKSRRLAGVVGKETSCPRGRRSAAALACDSTISERSTEWPTT
jgi:hypothetical protein